MGHHLLGHSGEDASLQADGAPMAGLISLQCTDGFGTSYPLEAATLDGLMSKLTWETLDMVSQA